MAMGQGPIHTLTLQTKALTLPPRLNIHVAGLRLTACSGAQHQGFLSRMSIHHWLPEAALLAALHGAVHAPAKLQACAT